MSDVPPIITAAGPLLSRYDVLFCDIWGVVHNGRTAYVAGCEALARFREQGGLVILVSNAPRTPAIVENILAEKHVPRAAWDAIVSSGGLALKYAHEQNFGRVHHIGPDRDLDLFDGAGLKRVELNEAQAILCTGLKNDRTETGECYRGLLEDPAARALPFICANPDLVVDVGDVQVPCAGAVATIYEELGGPVYWAGKPHGSAYRAARALAEDMRGPLAKANVLAIGDAVRTDLAAAAGFGIDALFVAQGIHRADVAPTGSIDPAALEALFKATAFPAIAAMFSLKW